MLNDEQLNELAAFITHHVQQTFGQEYPKIMPAVIAAQIEEHCDWDMGKVNEKTGATGASQLLPKTCEWLAARHPDLGECKPADFQWAIPAMVRYNKWLYDKFPYAESQEDRLAFMLSAYNGALKWMYRDRKLSIDRDRNPNVWFGHVELCSERTKWAIGVNRQYVRNILKNKLSEISDEVQP